jgi:hypothetical protein
MKASLILVSLIWSFALKAQSGDPLLDTNYQKLRTYIDAKTFKNSSKAVNLMFNLYNFGRERFTSSLLNPTLDSLYNFQLEYFKKTIINTWQGELYGSNWGNKSRITPNKKFIFTSKEASFYRNDSLVRKTPYFLVGNPYNHGDLISREFVIVFSDTNEEWAFYFFDEGDFVPYHGTANRLYILFNKMPGCVCGCPNELYSIEANSITGL